MSNRIDDWSSSIQSGMACGLSPSQQRLWVASALTGHSGAYHATFSWKICGQLNVDAFERALRFIVSRHPSLRTHFFDAPTGPLQVVSSTAEVQLERDDIARVGDLREITAQAKKKEALRPFELTTNLPVRARVLCLPNDAHLLLLSLHYLAVDGTAVGLLLAELGHAYRRFASGLTPDPQAQTDNVKEHLANLSSIGSALSEEGKKAYWRKLLARLPPLVDLPVDRARSSGLLGKGGWTEIALNDEISKRVALLAEATQTSVFSAVAGVVLLLIHGYTGESDLCIGYPVANRQDERMREWVGCMVDTLPLRVAVDSKVSFECLVRSLKTQIKEGASHSSYLIDEIIAESWRGVPGGRSPLSQIILNQNLNYEPRLSLEGLRVEPLSRETEEAPFELAWIIVAKSPVLRLRLEYNSDLFDRSTIERMVGHFKTLLAAVLANPHSRVQDLPLLTEAERHQILVEWNDTKADFPQDKCIHQLFEEQVERTPDAVAVVFEDQQLTYAQLNAKANQLAHHLRSLGVKPDTLVAICVERSLEMVIGLLGILKAGGAYVPLDPDYPKERLAFMLQDTSASVLLTQAHLSERVPRAASLIVCLDSEWVKIGNLADGNPPTVTSPLNLAYCIYTSGSTGRPKGALNTHRGFVNLSIWYSSHLAGHRAGERTLLASSLSFDLTQKNIIGTLIAGGLLILPNGQAVDIEALARAAVRHRPTRLNCSPSAFQAFEDAVLNGSLRTVVLGGEPVDPTLVADCNDKGLTLINSYGPTECADVAVSHLCEHGAQIDKCPLGRPLPNVQVYLLDAQLQPVPVGLKGELHIAGVGVGRGYLNRPDLTAEKFIPDPFGDPGSRMYKTGDLARYLPDGNIEFLGRIDHQVKIRGFRIELGEVEAALHRCDAVRKAVVLAREDQPGHKQLVAYVVPVSVAPAITDLRTQLSAFLPEYMVPSAWVFLDALPLNPNGKIDRKALPLPQTHLARQAAQAPLLRQLTGDPTYDGVFAILDELMPGSALSPMDDLFANGFHSLLLLRFVGLCRERLGVRLSVRDVYQQGTIGKISEKIQLASRAADTVKS